MKKPELNDPKTDLLREKPDCRGNAETRRDPAMDVIRCTALVMVITVHFFLNSGFYNQPVTGLSMAVMTMLRSVTICCVPLFLLLSGYLSCRREPGRDYYKKLVPVLVTYVLASVCCELWRLLKGEPFSPVAILGRLLGFKGAPYSWYIEMYIGLFLLAPYLNILYRALETRGRKLGLVVTLLALTALPSVFNVYRFTELSWWLSPASDQNYQYLIPQWWLRIYPLTYYILGCFLREYPLTRCRGWMAGAAVVLVGLYNCYRSWGSPFVVGDWNGYGSLLTVIQSVLLFSVLARGSYRRSGRIFGRLSGLCLGAYLVSWIFDQWFYGILNARVPRMEDKLVWLPLMVAAVTACSMALSWVINPRRKK